MSSNPNSNNRSIFVKGLRDGTTQHDLRDLFSRYGNVEDIYIPISYHNRRPRGFAYVLFEDLEDARRAVRKLNATFYRGRELKVEHAEGVRKTAEEMRAKEEEDRLNGSSNGSTSRRRSRSRDRDHQRGYQESRRDHGTRRSRSRSPRHRRRSPSPVHSSSRSRHHVSSRDHRDFDQEKRDERQRYSSPAPSHRRRHERDVERSPVVRSRTPLRD